MAMLTRSASTSKVAYTLKDDETIIEMNEDFSAKAIGAKLGRTELSIRYRQKWLRECSYSTHEELAAHHADKLAKNAPPAKKEVKK